MQITYKALLTGNQLHWLDDVPAQIANADEMPVHITILNIEDISDSTVTQGERMAEALELLSKANVNSQIDDPLAWERELRQDRVLPGRVD